MNGNNEVKTMAQKDRARMIEAISKAIREADDQKLRKIYMFVLHIL